MGIRRTLKRDMEKKLLKHRRTELLGLLNISKTKFQTLAPRVEKSGFIYGDVEFRNSKGYVDTKREDGEMRRTGYHKPSLKSQFSLLDDMLKQKIQEDIDLAKIKKELDEKKDEEGKLL